MSSFLSHSYSSPTLRSGLRPKRRSRIIRINSYCVPPKLFLTRVAFLDLRSFSEVGTCPSVAFGEGGAEWVAKGDIGIVFCNLLFGASCLFNVNP